MSVSTLAKTCVYAVCLLTVCSCQLPYLATGAYEQLKILRARTPLSKALKSVAITDSHKEKLRFAIEAKKFAKAKGLQCESDFNTFVQLDRPYVSYLLIASPKDKIEAKQWHFPIVGSFPYKGYFSFEEAYKQSKKMKQQDYDTYVRGVTAYSSLGWFDEPILSSMLEHNKFTLAETIFHECFHGTFFVKNEVELNERYAVFFAHYILLDFLEEKELNSAKKAQEKKWEDLKAFTQFLDKTIKNANQMYKDKVSRPAVMGHILETYVEELKPHLEELNYDFLFIENLNNASLVAHQTYFHDFTKLKQSLDKKQSQDIYLFLDCLRKNQKNYKNCILH